MLKMTRREMLKLTGLLAAGGFLAACGVPANEPDVEDPPVDEQPGEIGPGVGEPEGNVVVMHFLHEFTEDHVNEFEADNPGISLEVLEADLTRFFAMYAAGTPPDLLRVQAPSIPQYLARNMLLDLTPFFEASDILRLDDLAPANNYYRAGDPLSVGQGPIYGMVKDFSPDHTIFANTQLFEDAGVPVPDDTQALTYDEIEDISREITTFVGDRLEVLGYAYETGWVDRFIMNKLAETGENIFSADFTQLVIRDNEAAYEAGRYYYDLAQERLTLSVINPSPTDWFGNDFTQGTLAMAQYGFWFGAMAESEITEGDVIMLPGPTWTGVRRNPTVTATGMIISRPTNVPQAAWRVFEYYNGEEPALERAASGWGVPGLESMYDLIPSETEYEQQKLRVLLGELALETPPLQFNPYLGEEVVATTWNSQMDRALTGELTFDEALANVESQVNAAIQDGIERLE
jgi:multiple sugar transport system substrate-binding protein